jgi:hypothetical protein
LQLVVSSTAASDSLVVGTEAEMNDNPVEGGIDDSFF